VTIRQAGVRCGETGVSLGGARKVVDRSRKLRPATSPEVTPSQVRSYASTLLVPRVGAIDWRIGQWDPEPFNDGARDVVLNREDVIEAAVVTVGPELVSVGDAD
jgi:hypothetical protein